MRSTLTELDIAFQTELFKVVAEELECTVKNDKIHYKDQVWGLYITVADLICVYTKLFVHYNLFEITHPNLIDNIVTYIKTNNV